LTVAVATVVYDANLLYPAPLRDFLIRLAMSGLVRARWTAAIHDEWMRNLLRNRPDLTAEQLERTRDLMNRAVPDCLVTGYEKQIERLTLPDPNDRHVLAAAIRANANTILTLNTRDFPKAALASYGIVARRPDDSVTDLFDRDPDAIYQIAKLQRAALSVSRQSVGEFLETLRRVGLVKTTARLDLRRDEL
jgi:predicted nucleic acid-binding protein